NVALGTLYGVNASPDAFPFHVERNRVTDSSVGYFFGGIGVDSKENTASGATTACFWAQGIDVTLTHSTASHCNGAAFYVTAAGSVVGGNSASYSGAYAFEVLGPGALLTSNKASYTDGQAFGIVAPNGSATVAGNTGFVDRLDFCDNTGASLPALDANDFA